MWSLVGFFFCIIVLGFQLGWKDGNWGCLTAIAFFFVLALLCCTPIPAWGIWCLLLGICVIIVVWAYKSEQSTLPDRMDSLDDFATKYAISPEMQANVKGMIENNAPEIQKLSEELTQVIGIQPTRTMLIWGYLAKQGKIPPKYIWEFQNDYENILKSFGDAVYADGSNKSRIEAVREIKSARLNFLKWYDKEIQAHGMKYELLYIKGDFSRHGNVGCAKSIQECTHLEDSIVVFWMPMRKLVSGN